MTPAQTPGGIWEQMPGEKDREYGLFLAYAQLRQGRRSRYAAAELVGMNVSESPDGTKAPPGCVTAMSAKYKWRLRAEHWDRHKASVIIAEMEASSKALRGEAVDTARALLARLKEKVDSDADLDPAETVAAMKSVETAIGKLDSGPSVTVNTQVNAVVAVSREDLVARFRKVTGAA